MHIFAIGDDFPNIHGPPHLHLFPEYEVFEIFLESSFVTTNITKYIYVHLYTWTILLRPLTVACTVSDFLFDLDSVP